MVAMAYVLVLAIVALEIPLALTLRQRLDDEVRQQARTSANVVAVLAHSAMEHNDHEALQSVVGLAGRDVRGRVVVVDAAGTVVADSAGSRDLGVDISRRPEIIAALDGRNVQFTRRSNTLGRELLATAVPFLEKDRPIGAVRITQDVADVAASYRRTLAGLALIGLAVLLVGLIAGAIIARQIARPLRRFEGTARAVADGDLEARAPVEGSSEQQELARTFNEMTDRLAGSLKAQSRFVADASHQMRTPLTGLRLRLEEARAGSNDPAVEGQIDHGIAEVDRLSRTVDELLVLSQTGERDSRAEPLQIADLVGNAEARWTPIVEAAGKRLVTSIAGDLSVRASHSDIDRVIDALLENAVAYSPAGTAIELSCDAQTLTVRDHGGGLAGQDVEQLFERFSRGAVGTASSPGTGLGLAIARELARRWQAEVTLSDAPGGGALATIDFGACTKGPQ
jgi:signal transduction histidine kinase